MKSTASRLPDAGATERKTRRVLFLLGILLLLAVFVSMTIGRYALQPQIILRVFMDRISGEPLDPALTEANAVIFAIRIPRILLSILVGAALSASGAAYQGLFKNPMVSPDILGVSSGASVGAIFGILLGLPTYLIHVQSFLFGMGAVIIVMTLARMVSRGSGTLLIMVLSGTVISSVFSALTSLIKYLAPADDKLPEITFWLMGSFAKAGSYRNVTIMGVVFILGAVPLFLLRWRMNVMSFGEEEARSMGVNVKAIRRIVILCATLLTASSVALCGVIGWVGLIVPHMARILVGPNYGVMMPVAMIGGGLFTLLVDNVCRTAVSGELPIGIVTAMIGAPLFIYLLFRRRRDWT